MTAPATDARAGRGAPLTAFLELLALTGFAVAQPLLDVFGRSPEQFAFRDASRLVIVAFGVLIALGPAVGLYLVELLVGLVAGGRVRNVVHLGLLGVLGALAVVQVAKHAVSFRGPGLVVVAVAVAAGFVVLFLRAEAVRSWVRIAALAPVLFLVLFLVTSPVGEALRADEVQATDAVEVDHPAPVVMLVLDELPLESLVGPDGQIDAQRYPGFAELARSSTWYRNATGVSNATWHAVPAIVTGRYPHDSAPTAISHPDNLFTLLGGRYRLDVDESITRMCPRKLCHDADRPATQSLKDLGADARDVWRQQVSPDDSTSDPVAGLVEQPAAEDDEGIKDFGKNQPVRYTQFLDGLKPSGRPALHYLHILLPHVPWQYLPSGRQYPHPDPDPGKIEEADAWVDDPWPPELGRERHLLQLQYVDSLVKAMLDRLHETGLFDDALLVVTADHGVAFRPGLPVRGLNVDRYVPDIAPDLMWVPLFMKLPDRARGETTDAGVETVDILPTMADALGIDLPWKVDGVSTLGRGRAQDATKTYYQSKTNPFGVDPGRRVRIDPAAGWAEVLRHSIPEGLRGGGPLDGYRVGPRPELVGRAVGDLPEGPATDVRAVVDDADRYRDVDLEGPTIPSLVTGHLQGAPAGSLVVLSVGGKVGAVVPTWQDGGQPEAFAALLPESLFPAGDAHLQVSLLGPGDTLRATVAG
jgi:hypothetical protein